MTENKIDINIALRDWYMQYAMMCITGRALPDVRDGLKPVHRRILYSMFNNGLLRGNKLKCNTIVGDILKIHPHGDIPVYDALVKLAQNNETLLCPFIQGKGNFGKVYSKDAYASNRYTEAKLEDICNEMFRDINKDTVDFITDYNEIGKEPLALPNAYPNILINGSEGIAVGMATKICSFNLQEVCNATIEYINNPSMNLFDYIKAPDFSTGGYLLYDENELRKIYETGQGTVVLRSKYTYDEINNTIEVYEIPYTTTVQKIVEDITEMIKIKKVTEITDVRDESGFDAKANKEALRIAIDVKRNTDVEKLMLQLFKSTTLQDSFSCNFNVLVNYKPKVLGIKSILNEWIKFRIECISRSVKYDIKQKQDKIHLLEGLQKIVLDIDKVISLIRKTKKKKDVIPNLMKEFDLDEIQASYIVSIQLGNLNEEYLLERTKEIEGLIKEVTQLNKVLVSEKLIKNIIISQLKNVCENYGKPRKTEILYDYADAISKKEVINNYNVMYYLTEHGFFKKVPLTSLRNAGDNKTKDDDKIIKEAQGQNIDDIMFFTNKGNILRLKGHKVEDTKLSNYGMYIPSEFGLEDEVIVNMVVTNFTTPNESVLICFKNGFMTRVKLDMYNSANRVLKGNGESETVLVEHLKEDKELLIFTTDGKALIFNTSEIPTVSSRVAKGVKGINLGEGAEVLKIILDPIENMQLTIKTEKKEMKKKLDYKYHKGSRANAGLFIYNCRQKKDKILNVS